MMDQFYGVVASEVLQTKGYSDCVQQAAPTISGQLRLVLSELQTAHNSSGVSQSRPGHLTFGPRNPLRPLDYNDSLETANWMILFNSGESPESPESPESFKPENYSGSFEHYHYSGLTEHKHCIGSANEKGRTANPTLWDDFYFIHTENQSPKFIGDSQPSFRGEPNYESFVVHISTYKNFVGQPSGDSLAFLRCRRSSSTCAISTIARISAPALAPISSILVSAVKASSKLDNNLSSTLSLSRRRAISLCIAVVMKEPDVSSNSLTSSISSITSWGMRIEICFDLLFIVFEAITKPLLFKCDSLYIKKNHTKGLTCDSLEFKLNHTFDLLLSTNDNALQCSNTKRAPIHNVTETYTMALQHSTQTRPEKKYLWRFLALNRSDMCAKPYRISVEAPTEHDARRVLAPFFILSLSARLSAQGVCNV